MRRALGGARLLESLGALTLAQRLALAYVAALLPALFMAAVQPVWSRVDEAQHSDFVAHLAAGEWPVEGRARIAAPTLAVMRLTGTYRWQLPGEEPVPPETGVRDFTPPPQLRGVALQEWTFRHLWSYSYEAAQPPLFYLLAVPFWLAGKAAGGPLGAVYAVRLLDAMLVAALAPLAAAASLEMSPSGRRAAASALLAATVPGMLLNGTAVTNDALVAVLGGVLTLLALAGVRRGWSRRLALATGACLGAAMLAKLTAAGLGIGLLTAFIWPRLAGRQGLLACLRPALLAAAAAAAVVAPWLVANLAIYHQPVATAEADRLLGSFFGPLTLSPRVVAASFKNGFATFWTGEPWDTLPVVRPVSAIGLLWCLVAAVGVQRLLRAPGSRAATAVITSISLGTAVWAFAAMLLSHIGGLLPGRYVYPALVAIAVVLVQGGAAALAAAGLTAAPRHHRVAVPAGGEPVSSEAALGEITMSVDRVVRDPAGSRLFVHLRVVNGAPSRMEWWPVAVARFPGRPLLASTYAEGTPFSQDLDAGSAQEGWLVFDGVRPADLRGSFEVGFLGVAGDSYRDYGDLVVAVPPA